MVGGSNQNVFLIQIDASSFAEFKISEFEISRIDCNVKEMLNPSTNKNTEANRYCLGYNCKKEKENYMYK